MYTYKSHHESSTRAFDHLYDPNFISNKVKIHHMNCKSISDTAPMHIIPSFYSMFSEIRRNKFYFAQRNGLPYDSNDCCPKIVNKKSVNYNSYSIPSNVQHEDNFYRFEPKNVFEQITMKNKVSQTMYREVEMQTEAYLPQPKLRIGETKLPEILYVKCNEKPDLEDIKKIERDVIRRKWEDDLRQLPMSLGNKVKQMEVFEMQDQLLREKELNEIQEKRMDYVLSTINDREEATKLKCREKLLTVYKTASEINIKERAKFEVKNERKLRQLSKINSQTKYHKPNMLKTSKSIDFGRFNLYDCSNYSKIDYNSNRNRDALWIPKQKVKVVRHCMNKEETRNNLYNEIKKHNKEFDKNVEYQFRRPKCQEINPVDVVYECGGDQVDIPLDVILIQKTIKGIDAQKSLKSGKKDKMTDIHSFRKLYPLRCVIEVFDGENFIPFENKSQSQSDSCCSKDIIINDIKDINVLEDEESSKDSKMNDELKSAVTEVLQQALLIAQDTINRKILREANEQRFRREELAQIEALKQKLIKMRQELTERKTDKFFKDLTAEVIEMVIPLVIEDISEKEALEFIMKKATEVSADTFNRNITNKAKIKKFIKEILIPHIEAKSDRSDEHLIALFGSYDAFNCFIDKCFSTDQ
ncbi:hypothetical protein ACKWTF_001131 [Chironomus riparius]